MTSAQRIIEAKFEREVGGDDVVRSNRVRGELLVDEDEAQLHEWMAELGTGVGFPSYVALSPRRVWPTPVP